MDDVIFEGTRYVFSDGYYRRYKWGEKDQPSNLHRAVWIKHNGPIPPNHDIHHIDEDGANCSISNLECLPLAVHRRMHALKRMASGSLKPPSKEALTLAAEWHKSPEGLAWHSEAGRESWKQRKWHTISCQECGRDFGTPYPNRTKYCHLNCKMTALRRRRGRPVGTRPDRKKVVPLIGKKNAGSLSSTVGDTDE